MLEASEDDDEVQPVNAQVLPSHVILLEDLAKVSACLERNGNLQLRSVQ